MPKLPKRKKGYNPYTFFEVCMQLPTPQITVLGQILTELGKWLLHSAEVQEHRIERLGLNLEHKYQDINKAFDLVVLSRFSIDDAVNIVLAQSKYFTNSNDLKQILQDELKQNSKLALELRNKKMAIALLNGATIREVADKYGVSKSQTWRIKRKNLDYWA